MFPKCRVFSVSERVQQVKNHPELTRLFILNLHKKQSSLVAMTFELSSNAISSATSIPDVGEKWLKREKLDMNCYEPFIKPR